jgi:hypothetical protein
MISMGGNTIRKKTHYITEEKDTSRKIGLSKVVKPKSIFSMFFHHKIGPKLTPYSKTP